MAEPKQCIVSFEDSKGVRHAVKVGATSLYEAVEAAAALLSEHGWAEDLANTAELRVEVQSPSAVHTIDRMRLRRWVELAPGSPRDITLKNNLRKKLPWF